MNTGSMSAKTACDVAVIGGGAAGMMAALQAAWAGARVALLEKNEKLGKKIYITGKGRCNVTNVADIDDFFKQIPRNPRFLNAAARQFTHEDVTGLLEMLGTPTKVERGGRVFPESDKASDVTRALDRGMRDAGVVISLNTQVAHVRQAEGGFDVELTQGGTLRAKSVIVATGGVSYPSTGSTGDGYLFAKENGLNVTRLSASLVGLTMDEKWPTLLQGLALKNVTLTLKKGKKVLYSDLGEMLFTHFGISGPLTLTMSCHLPENLAEANVTLDLKPGLTAQQLDTRLQRELAEDSRRQLRNVLPHLLPASFAEIFPELCGVDGSKVCAQVTKEEREKLVSALKALPIPLKKLAPIEEAIVTRGGVNVREIDPATMESRKVSGLYFAGEVIDVDAHTGGYNLQIAWATGALAGQSAGEEEIEAI